MRPAFPLVQVCDMGVYLLWGRLNQALSVGGPCARQDEADNQKGNENKTDAADSSPYQPETGHPAHLCLRLVAVRDPVVTGYALAQPGVAHAALTVASDGADAANLATVGARPATIHVTFLSVVHGIAAPKVRSARASSTRWRCTSITR